MGEKKQQQQPGDLCRRFPRSQGRRDGKELLGFDPTQTDGQDELRIIS